MIKSRIEGNNVKSAPQNSINHHHDSARLGLTADLSPYDFPARACCNCARVSLWPRATLLPLDSGRGPKVLDPSRWEKPG